MTRITRINWRNLRHWRLCRFLYRTVIVAVRAMSMVHVPAHHVVKVIAVWNAFMPAFRAVSVFAFVGSTMMVGRACIGV